MSDVLLAYTFFLDTICHYIRNQSQNGCKKLCKYTQFSQMIIGKTRWTREWDLGAVDGLLGGSWLAED